MIVTYAIYEVATGRIRGHASGPEGRFDPQPADDCDVVQGEPPDPATHYYDAAEDRFVARPELAFDRTEIAADGADTAILAGLPEPCTVTVDGTAHKVEDGVLELRANTPGTYTVAVPDAQAFPAQAFSTIVTAT